METALVLFLIVIANLTLYWIFFGKKKFEQQLYPQEKGQLKFTEKTTQQKREK
ncbi:MAG TPA: hypothetical protein VJI15_04960 [Candidatus Nanoarchaeia archaeon]|nr:hypothetical protein [Candidatus Nanoarchaeia archaeon]